MGIASRTKWEERAQWPLATVGHLDPSKLAHAARLLSGRRTAVPLFDAMRQRRAERVAKANLKAQGHRIRRRKAARQAGWRPYAQR